MLAQRDCSSFWCMQNEMRKKHRIFCLPPAKLLTSILHHNAMYFILSVFLLFTHTHTNTEATTSATAAAIAQSIFIGVDKEKCVIKMRLKKLMYNRIACTREHIYYIHNTYEPMEGWWKERYVIRFSGWSLCKIQFNYNNIYARECVINW